MHSSQFGITFTDSRGPVNSDGPIHCIHSLNRMVRYSVMPVCAEQGYVLCSILQFSHLDIVLLELKKRHKFIFVSYSYFTHLLWQLSADFLAPPKICSVPANFCSVSAQTSLCQLLLLPIRPSLLWASRHSMSIVSQFVFQIAR